MRPEQPWFLKNSGFMERVQPEDRDVFHQVCTQHHYRRNESIFRIGDPATDLHLIARGRVKLVRPTADGHERILAVCGPDDFVGEAFLRDADSYRVEAVAMSHEVMTCPISREQFRRLAMEAPGFALTFAEVLASHLFHCREQMSASYDPVRIRVAKIFVEQAERFGKRVGEDGWHLLETELKHDELASLASASRVAVTMAIAKLREDGALRGSRGRYELHVPVLTALADEA